MRLPALVAFMRIHAPDPGNNFDAVRMALAAMVVLPHVAALSVAPLLAPLGVWIDSDFAVKGFFAISGYLVTGSWRSSRSPRDFAQRRLRRIYPAYLCALMLCLAIGLATTTLDARAFLGSGDTLRYIAWNAIFLNFMHPTLPGVFAGNALQAMDGALWTIKIEVALYACVPLIARSFSRFGAPPVALLLVAGSTLWVWYFRHHIGGPGGAELARQFPGQLSYFVLGALLAWQPAIMKNLGTLLLVALVVFVAGRDSLLRIAIEPFCYAGAVLFLATQAAPSLRAGRFGDLSYGIYLYHFPIIQLLVHLDLFDTTSVAGCLALIAATTFVTGLAAFASWHGVEKRLLRRATRVPVPGQ
jgi:peptidoglycan/LPS O-acetylase OafA/YrhL